MAFASGMRTPQRFRLCIASRCFALFRVVSRTKCRPDDDQPIGVVTTQPDMDGLNSATKRRMSP